MVSQRVAACVNLLDKVKSVYCWQGKTVEENEVQLLIKTTAERLPALRRAFSHHHPYEFPELIVLQPDSVSATYERWVVTSETRRYEATLGREKSEQRRCIEIRRAAQR